MQSLMPVKRLFLRDNKMKKLLFGFIIASSVLFGGCSSLNSFFTMFDEVAIDKHYIQKQCPTFDHQFEIPAKKYLGAASNNADAVVMKTNDLLVSLESNTRAREIFNALIVESNKPIVDTDRSESKHRQVKNIFINRKCPTYTYSPEFKARKLTSSFVPDDGVIYVVVSIEKMTFEVEKHRKVVATYNAEVEKLNK